MYVVNTRQFLATLGAAAIGICTAAPVRAQAAASPLIRWAELDVDPSQLDSFKAAASAHANAVLKTEAGVIAFHAVSEADNPARIRVFEMYDDAEAYRAHLQQAHFRSFVAATQKMISRRQLYDAVPIRLGNKPRLPASLLVRIAELEIDPSQLQSYRAAVSEEIDESIRLEPGVLTIYSVALKDTPNQLRFLEIYADEAAYSQHLESPHFKKYVETAKPMIRSRELYEAQPLFLGLRQR